MLFHVTVAAEGVEHRFDLQSHLRIGPVTVDAETLTGVVGEVVVTGDAVDGAVVEVSERERQQRSSVDHFGSRVYFLNNRLSLKYSKMILGKYTYQ